MEQPFIFGRSVTGQYFTDREQETTKLVNNFKYGVNTILISPRRYGKTSIVKRAIEKSRHEDLLIVFADIFSSRNPEEFCRIFADCLIKQTSSKIEEWVADAKRFLSGLAPRFNISPDPMGEISFSFGIKPSPPDIDYILDLPEKIAKEKNKRIVVCIDEFQQIGEYPDSLHFQKILRTHWQHHQLSSYCLFGSKKHMMNELFEKQSNPFYKFGDVINLKKINREHWVKYILNRFKDTGKKIQPQIAEELCRLTDDYSSYVQQLALLLWFNFDETRQLESLKKSFEELLDHSSVLFEQQTQNLSAYQMNFLKALIEGVENNFTKKEFLERYNLGTPGNLIRLKSSLIKKELIDVAEGRYFISDPVLKEWLKRRLY